MKKIVTHYYALHNILERTNNIMYLKSGTNLQTDMGCTFKQIVFQGQEKRIIPSNKIWEYQPPRQKIALKGLVRPVMEYFSPVWNPRQQKYTTLIK